MKCPTCGQEVLGKWEDVTQECIFMPIKFVSAGDIFYFLIIRHNNRAIAYPERTIDGWEFVEGYRMVKDRAVFRIEKEVFICQKD